MYSSKMLRLSVAVASSIGLFSACGGSLGTAIPASSLSAAPASSPGENTASSDDACKMIERALGATKPLKSTAPVVLDISNNLASFRDQVRKLNWNQAYKLDKKIKADYESLPNPVPSLVISTDTRLECTDTAIRTQLDLVEAAYFKLSRVQGELSKGFTQDSASSPLATLIDVVETSGVPSGPKTADFAGILLDTYLPPIESAVKGYLDALSEIGIQNSGDE